MIKKFSLVFMLFISSLLFGCQAKDVEKTDDKEVYATFRGTIEKIDGHTAIVHSKENGITGRVFVDLSVNSAVTFQVGDKIEVGFDGIIMESDPARIKTLSVKLVE